MLRIERKVVEHKGFNQSYVLMGERAGERVGRFDTLLSNGVKQEGAPVGRYYSCGAAAWEAYNATLRDYCASYTYLKTIHIFWRREPYLEHEVGVGYYVYSRLFVCGDFFYEQYIMSKMQEPYVVNVKHEDYKAAITGGPEKGTAGWRAQKGYSKSNATGFRATGHRVLLSPDIVEEISAGGIVLPTKAVNAEKQTAVMATVIEIGLDCWRDKDADFCEVGDRVLIGQYTGKFHKSPKDGKEYRFVTDLDIISPIEA